MPRDNAEPVAAFVLLMFICFSSTRHLYVNGQHHGSPGRSQFLVMRTHMPTLLSRQWAPIILLRHLSRLIHATHAIAMMRVTLHNTDSAWYHEMKERRAIRNPGNYATTYHH